MHLRPDYPIRTERLLLRPVLASDIDALLSYRSRADVARYVPFRPMTRERVAELVHGDFRRIELTDEKQSMTLAAEVASSGRVVGDVVLFFTSREHRAGEVGWVFHPDAGGRGYATEAARALLGLAFDGLGLHRVIARVDVRNRPSARLARRLGMRQEAHLLQNEWFKGEWSDELDFAMLEHEWRSTAR